MKRSWVLADGDRKKKPTTVVDSSSSGGAGAGVSPSSLDVGGAATVALSKEDSDVIQGYVDNMNRIKHQTEHICPEVR